MNANRDLAAEAVEKNVICGFCHSCLFTSVGKRQTDANCKNNVEERKKNLERKMPTFIFERECLKTHFQIVSHINFLFLFGTGRNSIF